jgi:hypothetical protein
MEAATAGNAVHGFRASGIWHLIVAEIPDSAYIGDRPTECEETSSNAPQNTSKISANSNT